jgi:hypothetical protein
MTDQREMIRKIEEGLGSEGSHEIAVAMFHELKRTGAITFDAASGFEWVTDDPQTKDAAWDSALTVVIGCE